MQIDYGRFNENGDEYCITNPETPRAFDNFLWNEAIFSNVQQTGTGYADYQIEDGEAIQLLTGNGRICDFDVFGRDSLMSRLIYIRDDDTGEFWNANWEPVCRPYESYECRHGLGYTTIRSRTEGIDSTFALFVPPGKDPVELWTLRLGNPSGRPRQLSVFCYNQFQFRYKWGFDSYGDMLYRSSRFSDELNAVIASKHPHIAPHPYLTGYLTADVPAAGWDGTRNAFVGLYRSLNEPAAVVTGRCSNTPGSSDATIGALQFRVRLEADQETSINLILGAGAGEADIARMRSKYFGHFDDYRHMLSLEKEHLYAQNTVNTPDAQFDRLFNFWLKQQTAFGAQWCRWGWFGYRDIVQHGMGVSSFAAARTKAILLEALAYQYQNGLALRGWNATDTKAYSDSALWLVFTLVAYLKETADFGLLEQSAPFFDGSEATVLQHIQRALDFLENHKGVHGLCLIKFGDWNDSLTAVGREGKGESVWLSEAYAEALRQMSELYAFIHQQELARDYQVRYDSIKRCINEQAWDGGWYKRCFDDCGGSIGSHENKEGKIFIETQAWALIAGIADQEKAEKLLDACETQLATPMGYRLLTPTFTGRDDNIGRISCLEPGICENGTIYSHVNAWMILGLLRTDRADEAYAALQRIAPGYFASEDDLKHRCPPFIFANCYFGPDHRNSAFQMEFTWITGSVAWFHQVLSTEMLGIKPGYAGLMVEPHIPSSWDGFEIKRYFRNAWYHIHVKNPNHAVNGLATLTADGVALTGTTLPLYQDGQVHQIEVLLA